MDRDTTPAILNCLKTAMFIRGGQGPSGTIFQLGVVRDIMCSDCVGSGKVYSGTMLILGDLGRSVFSPG